MLLLKSNYNKLLTLLVFKKNFFTQVKVSFNNNLLLFIQVTGVGSRFLATAVAT